MTTFAVVCCSRTQGPVSFVRVTRYELFESVFEGLPIATVVDSKVFVMHGGLFRRKGVRLSHVAAVKRRRSIPVQSVSFQDTMFEDLMWSDPRPIQGSSQSDRGAGVFWGVDITQQFCKLNRIEFIVRSHECVPDGFVPVVSALADLSAGTMLMHTCGVVFCSATSFITATAS